MAVTPHGRRPRGIFLNTGKASCSIFESGRMVHECIGQSDRYTLDYLSLDMIDLEEFADSGRIRRIDQGAAGKVFTPDYDFWVFNWHFITMASFVPISLLDRLPGMKFTIVLELAPDDPLKLIPASKFDGFMALDPDVESTAVIFPFPRPLEGEPRPPVKSPPLVRPPVIGSFGFSTPGKGFELLIEAVSREFDQATVRINVPHGTYTAPEIHATNYAEYIGRMCKQIAKPGIEVVFTHEFMAPEAVIDWCAANDLNCFMYTRQQPGLSATTDQAIISGRPLLTLGNDTFRHVHRYIPPYPEIGFKHAIATTSEAVAHMQRDWSKTRFKETFECMLASFGVLTAGPSAPRASSAAEPAVRVLHATLDGSYRDDIFSYARRLSDALGRTGNWRVTTVQCSSPEELSAVTVVLDPEIVVLSGADAVDRSGFVSALDDVTGPKVVITDDVEAWSSGPLVPFRKRPIIPFFTVTTKLRKGTPAIWLIGFSDPASPLEAAVQKIASQLPAAHILVEAAAEQRHNLAARVRALEPGLKITPSIDVSLEALPEDGARLIDTVASAALIVIHNDPEREREIESYAGLCMITERAVVFTGTGAAPFATQGVLFEEATVPALIDLGMSAGIKVLADLGEWQIASDIRSLCRNIAARANRGLARFSGNGRVPSTRNASKTAEFLLSRTGDRAFLYATFLALLGRPPDAEATARFLSQLNAGEKRGSVLLEISQSPEARARGFELPGIDTVYPEDDRRPTRTAAHILSVQVDDDFLHAAFRGLLGRAADPQGLAYFRGELNRGRSRGSVLLEISRSAEARQLPAGLPGLDAVARDGEAAPVRTAAGILSLSHDEDFLEATFGALLGRPLDPEGADCFMRQLRQGTSRTSILHAIQQSPEALARGAQLPGLDEIAPEPEPAPARSAAEVLSAETGAAFLLAAYTALLGRTPDPVGAAHFSAQLELGRRRESILVEISQSAEARNCALELPGLKEIAQREEEASRDPDIREAELLRSLSAVDNRLYRLTEHAVTLAASAPQAVPLPLRMAASDPLLAVEQLARSAAAGASVSASPGPGVLPLVISRPPPALTRLNPCVFLLAGVYGRVKAIGPDIRDLADAWQAHRCLRMVLWDSAARKLRLMDDSLAAPDLSSSSNLEREACPDGSWLVAPQNLRPDHDTVYLIEMDAIMEAHRLGLRTAFAFHGAEPLRRRQDAGPAASAFDCYTQALLLSDVVLPVSPEAEDDIIALFTQHQLATWGPVIKTVPLPEYASGPAGWSEYARAVDDRLQETGRPGRRLQSLYYWVDNAAAPDQIAFALRLARTLSELGVSLIPTVWNPATGSLTAGSELLAPGSVPWGAWTDPGSAGAPAWIVAPTGLMPGVREASLSIASHGLRLAILTAARAGESTNAGEHADLELLTRAHKVLALSEPHYRDIYRFLLSWRGKVHSTEDRFRLLPAPVAEPESQARSRVTQTRPSTTKAVFWAPIDDPEVLPRMLEAAEEAARRSASRLSIRVVGASASDLVTARLDSFAWFDVSPCGPGQVDEALAEANFAIHAGRLRSREPEVVRSLWAGIPCVISGSGGDAAEPGTIPVDLGCRDAVLDVIGGILRRETIFSPTSRWIDFAQQLLDELATDRLRDACEPLRKTDRDLSKAFPNLVSRRPRLSVCLSTYNRAGWVKRNLENIYSQVSSDRDDVEIFVVDNASPDQTPEMVQPYLRTKNFRYHRNAKNVGMLGNLAVTAQRARGEYVWILGDDDLTRADCINKVLDVLHRRPGIGLVYLNYGYTSEPDPLSIADLTAFLNSYHVLEPACPDQMATVKELAAKNENFYTAIYSHVYRRDHGMRSYCQDTSGRPFSTMLTCIPTSYYVLHYMADEPAYWIGEPSLVVNSNVSWQDYGPLFDMEQLPRAWDLAERNGGDGDAIDRRRANRLWLVAMMWKDLFEDDRAGNTPFFSAPRVLMRLKHLPEIDRYIPVLQEIYTRAHQAGHPGASMRPDDLFSAFLPPR